MSCFCLFGRPKPRPDGDRSVPLGAAADGADKQQAASSHISDAKSAQESLKLSAAQTEVRVSSDGNQHAVSATSKDEGRAISPSEVNGHLDETVPEWVQKEPVHAHGASVHRQAAGQPWGAVGVVGEVGSMNHGTGGFQTRATPRTVFRQAEESTGRANHDTATSSGAAVGRPPRPPAAGAEDTKSGSVYDWMQIDPGREQPGAKAATAANGRADHSAANVAGGETFVQDGDSSCVAGAVVVVSQVRMTKSPVKEPPETPKRPANTLLNTHTHTHTAVGARALLQAI